MKLENYKSADGSAKRLVRVKLRKFGACTCQGVKNG